jgi:UPF0755 protein
VKKILWLLLLAVLAGAGWITWAVLTPVQPAPKTVLLLHPGYSSRRIARELKNAGVINSESAFLLWHFVHRGRSLKAGEYLFENPANIATIHSRLAHGDVFFHTVVVPEGYTMFDIAHAIEEAGLGPAEDFVKTAQSETSLIADIAPHAPSLEGYLFPETYEFTRMQSMRDMAAAMVKQFRQVARQVGLIPEAQSGGEAQPDAIGRTVIMASIVEKETAVPEERPLVASVYYNRLERKVALDADPSIIYAELLAGTYQGALHHADLFFPSPYNTYRNAGLPPGPIGNPGKGALEAAMHPAQSDYLYFVADAQGHHRFAKTLEEHDRNVAAYRQAMRGK